MAGSALKLKVDGKDYRKLFFCGDIHGHYRLLMKALKKKGFDKKRDLLICTGDLVDRGDESLKCLELLDEDWFLAAMGNHDYAMWASFFSKDRYETKFFWRDFWQHPSFGSNWFFDLSKQEQKELSPVIDKVGNLPLFIEAEREVNGRKYKFGVTHADIFSYDWNKIPTDTVRHYDFIQSRDKYKLVEDGVIEEIRHIENIDFLITGHTIVKELTSIGNHYYIDTGAYKKGISIIEDTVFVEHLENPELGLFKQLEAKYDC